MLLLGAAGSMLELVETDSWVKGQTYAQLNAVFTATLNMWIVTCFAALAFCFTTVVLLSPISADNVQLWCARTASRQPRHTSAW